MKRQAYYVYIHRRKTDGSIFYVGKGYGQRAYVTGNGRNRHWHNINNKHGRTVHIVRSFRNEFCALTYEIILIGILGKENLANKSDGGRYNSGWKQSEKWKENASKRQKGSGNANYGKLMKQEQRDKIAASLKGRPSPKKGKPSNHDVVKQAATMRRIRAEMGENNPWKNVTKTEGFLNKRLTVKPVETRCGLKFEGMANAVRWLKENGFPKANHAAISYSCNHENSFRYGYTWSYSNG